jgi:hypothetical protein
LHVQLNKVYLIFQYPQWFKKEVAEYAIALGQRAVGRMMSISQRRVFDWVNSLKESSKLSKHTESEDSYHLSSRCTTQLIDYDVEKDIFDWVQEQLPVRVRLVLALSPDHFLK